MKKTKKIEQEELKLSNILIEPWESYNSEEEDSLLEDYSRKYDEFIKHELDYYYMLI